MSRLLVLGASGGCGSWIVRLAAERGHDVTAVIRAESRYEAPSGVDIAMGSVLDQSFLRSIIRPNDVVLSGLGLRRASLFPWSKLLSPHDLVEKVTQTVIAIASETPIHRFIWISAGGVGESIRQTSFPVRGLIRAGHVGTAYNDLEAAEAAMNNADVPALTVRPVTLIPGSPTGRAESVGRYGLFSTIRRGDVAKWMLDVADGTREFAGDHVLLGSH